VSWPHALESLDHRALPAVIALAVFAPSVTAVGFVLRLLGVEMHQKRKWKPFRRARCTCGLPWPCLELRLLAARSRPKPPANFRIWNGTTAVWPQVGRAGRLTPAQAYRANGGRS